MNDDKFYLYTLIALLLGIIGFWLIAPIFESGFIQYISFGAMLVSSYIFITKGYNILKEKRSNNKLSKEINKITSTLPKMCFENTDMIEPLGINERVCVGSTFEKFNLTKLSKIVILWKKEIKLEYVVVETFCNKLLNEIEDKELKVTLEFLECKVYTYPDGWNNITTRVVLESKITRVIEIYDVLLSYGFDMGTIKDRRTNANIYLTIFDNKVEYTISHKYLENPYEFNAKIKKILNAKI